MFSVNRREAVRTMLLDRARADERITGAAITGSAASRAEDLWSDIDLFFGVTAAVPVDEVVSGWGEFVYRDLGALHHFDLRPGSAIYRAFLLGDLLEVDLGFAPETEFGPVGAGGFQVVFGAPAPRRPVPVDLRYLIGRSWHHVLHARTAIERGAPWLAEYWISALRDHILTVACVRLGYSVEYAKGADRLPRELTDPLNGTLVRSVDVTELRRALVAVTHALIRELRDTDAAIAATLATPLLDAVENVSLPR